MAPKTFVTPEQSPEQTPQQSPGKCRWGHRELTRITVLVVSVLTVMGAYEVLLRKHSPPLKSALWFPLAVLFAYLRPLNDFSFLFGGLLQFPVLGSLFLAGARRWNAVRSLGTVLLIYAACALIAYRVAAR